MKRLVLQLERFTSGVDLGYLFEEWKVNEKWIAGIRKWWKQWVQEGKAVSKLQGEKGYKKAIKYLEDGEDRVQRLRKDLYMTKGFWPGADVTGERKVDLKGTPWVMTKIAYFFDDAEEELRDKRSRLDTWYKAVYVDDSFEARTHRGCPYGAELKRYGPNKKMDALDVEIFTLTETVDKVDSFISRKTLRAIGDYVKKWSKFQDDPGKGDPEETEFSIGKVKVIVAPTELFGKLNVAAFKGQTRVSPTKIKQYIKGFSKAKALLDKAGFGRMWYGDIFVRPSGSGFEFAGTRSGKKMRSAAHYDIGLDHVVMNKVALSPEGMAETTVHELGHRWYYKFMSRADRLRFASYFGDVLAVTGYGSENPVEDFAEVFKWYVMGKKLTSDQKERFREFAIKGKKVRRQEDIDPCIARLSALAEKIDVIRFSEVAQ